MGSGEGSPSLILGTAGITLPRGRPRGRYRPRGSPEPGSDTTVGCRVGGVPGPPEDARSQRNSSAISLANVHPYR